MITVIPCDAQSFTVSSSKTTRSYGQQPGEPYDERFHLTIPYIIACLMAYYVFFATIRS